MLRSLLAKCITQRGTATKMQYPIDTVISFNDNESTDFKNVREVLDCAVEEVSNA